MFSSLKLLSTHVKNRFYPDVVSFHIKQDHIRKALSKATSNVFLAKAIKQWVDLNGDQ